MLNMYLESLTTSQIGYQDWSTTDLGDMLRKLVENLPITLTRSPRDIWPMEKIWLTKNYKTITQKTYH